MGKKKEIEKFEIKLQKYLDKKEYVKILREVTLGDANIYGFLLNLSKDFLQIRETDDFMLQGEIIIRTDQFDSIRSGKYDRVRKKILRAENVFPDKNVKKTKVKLDSWHRIFESLYKKNIHVIIECEYLKRPTFTIGPIVKVNAKSVDLRYYDPSGQLEKKLTRIKFKHITLLKFNDNYTKTFKKYLKESN